MLTKPKVLSIEIKLRVVEQSNGRTRYVLSAADYERLINAVQG